MFPLRRSVAACAFACMFAILPVAAAPKPAPLDTVSSLSGLPADTGMARLVKLDKELKYQTGTVPVGDGLATLKLPDGYRYLDPSQTNTVLTAFWGNPPGFQTLGMIWAPGQQPLTGGSWAVVIQYEENGYVKDDDADKINYDDLLKDMQKSTEAQNEQRKKQGYAAMHLVGWAEKPYYDKQEHKLHWAQELRVDDGDHNTLNYDIRILGRRGVLVLTAVAPIADLATVKAGMPPVLQSVEFDAGHKYSEFDPKIDKVATYGIAGLVAGGVLAKVGFFKLLIAALIAAKKFVVLGFLAVVAFFKRFFKGPSAQKEIVDVTKPLPEEEKKQG